MNIKDTILDIEFSVDKFLTKYTDSENFRKDFHEFFSSYKFDVNNSTNSNLYNVFLHKLLPYSDSELTHLFAMKIVENINVLFNYQISRLISKIAENPNTKSETLTFLLDELNDKIWLEPEPTGYPKKFIDSITVNKLLSHPNASSSDLERYSYVTKTEGSIQATIMFHPNTPESTSRRVIKDMNSYLLEEVIKTKTLAPHLIDSCLIYSSNRLKLFLCNNQKLSTEQLEFVIVNFNTSELKDRAVDIFKTIMLENDSITTELIYKVLNVHPDVESPVVTNMLANHPLTPYSLLWEFWLNSNKTSRKVVENNSGFLNKALLEEKIIAAMDNEKDKLPDLPASFLVDLLNSCYPENNNKYSFSILRK